MADPRHGRTTSTFRVPLLPGGSVGHWQLGRRREERFDVADRPMAGDMDPLFFVSRDRNFIPHEYPCRTEFAALYRGRRPEPRLEFEPHAWWFPFGSPRVDLSGFWFRPTVVECRARTAIESPVAQTARFRFATCGGALLSVGGREVTFLAGYRRNFEESIEVDVELVAGVNPVEVWFGDLCERDARFYFELTMLEGDPLAVALPVPVPAGRAGEFERLLDGMRFERPTFTSGVVALRLPSEASADIDVDVRTSGDSIGAAPTGWRAHIAAGSNRLVMGDVSELPQGFRQITLTFGDGGFRLSRTLGVEVCDVAATKAPPASLRDRANEALAFVASRGEPDANTAFAAIALGRHGATTNRMIDAALPAIDDCHDCADFLLVPLIWARTRWADRMAPAVRGRLDAAIVGFRYWMDEPGNDVMWFFSENHALLFHTACYLAGALFPEARFRRSGRTGREQAAVGHARLLAWFDHFERVEMGEWNSAPYFPIDFKGLVALLALAPDAGIRGRALRATLRLIEIVAMSCHRGVLTASQGRSYEHSLRPGRSLELSSIARLFFGAGAYGSHFHCLAELPVAVLDHGLAPDPGLAAVAIYDGADALEWTFAQGENRIAPLYHYKTRHGAMGSVARYRAGAWGYQETVLHARIGDRPESQVWINHPGEAIVSGHARPSYWGGCGTLPRVHQYRGLAVVDFSLPPGQLPFTHAWLPAAEMDETRTGPRRVWARGGSGLLLLAGNGPFDVVTDGPMAGCEVRLHGPNARWIVRLSDTDQERDLAGFAARFDSLEAHAGADGSIVMNDPDYGEVVCHFDGRIEAEGRLIEPSTWTSKGILSRLPVARR